MNFKAVELPLPDKGDLVVFKRDEYLVKSGVTRYNNTYVIYNAQTNKTFESVKYKDIFLLQSIRHQKLLDIGNGIDYENKINIPMAGDKVKIGGKGIIYRLYQTNPPSTYLEDGMTKLQAVDYSPVYKSPNWNELTLHQRGNMIAIPYSELSSEELRYTKTIYERQKLFHNHRPFYTFVNQLSNPGIDKVWELSCFQFNHFYNQDLSHYNIKTILLGWFEGLHCVENQLKIEFRDHSKKIRFSIQDKEGHPNRLTIHSKNTKEYNMNTMKLGLNINTDNNNLGLIDLCKKHDIILHWKRILPIRGEL
jgi:hypothetical protein